MDAERFDSLTKVLARGVPRRRVLKGLGAALVGALGVGAMAEAAPRPGNGPCKSPNTRCGKGKTTVCTNLSTDNNNCGTCGTVCPSGTTCSNGACQTVSPPSCPAGSLCQSQCQNTTNVNCVCGTTFDGGSAVCYLSQNGCAGHGCSTSADCADLGPTSTCILDFCTANLCTTSADCGAGSACVNLNGGCGGCDNFTGSTQGICNPICTS